MNAVHGTGLLLVAVPLALLAKLPAVSAEPLEAQPFEAEPPRGADVLLLRSRLPELARIPGGVFRMGSTSEEIEAAFADCKLEPHKTRCRIEDFGDERPVRTVELSSFWLQRHEVSVAEYARCEAARRCRPIPYFRGADRFRRDEYPASLVSWEDARDYCVFWGGRLPTEAEYERAARGTQGRIYPWGNLYNERASNHGQLATDRTNDSDGFFELAPVGSFLDGVTPEGIFDLAGNVAEWVLDRYAPEYAEHDVHDPQGPSAGSGSSQRVVRGGDYESPRSELRGAARAGQPPTTRLPTLGFRCAKPLKEPPPKPETPLGAG